MDHKPSSIVYPGTFDPLTMGHFDLLERACGLFDNVLHVGKGSGRLAARAAGGACHANPVLILIPCHRIVGADGSLTGFGAGVDAKDLLLRLENPSFYK